VHCEPLNPEKYDFWLQGTEDPVNVIVSVDRVPGGEVHTIGLYDHVERNDFVLAMGFDTPHNFLRVSGNAVTGEVDLVDNRPGANRETIRVTFEGRCP
jgi:hypothetical protein